MDSNSLLSTWTFETGTGAVAANQLGDEGVAEVAAALRPGGVPLTALAVWSESPQ